MIELMGDCVSNDNLTGNQCNGLYDLFKDDMSGRVTVLMYILFTELQFRTIYIKKFT